MENMMAARRRKDDRWGELGSRKREAEDLEKSETALRRALGEVAPAVARARSLLRPDWSRDAKDAVLAAYNPLKAAIDGGALTQKTSGAELLRLPAYGDADHPHSRARYLATRHGELLVEAEAVRRMLAKATYGDTDAMRIALDNVDTGSTETGAAQRASVQLREGAIEYDETERIQNDLRASSYSPLMRSVRPITGKLTRPQERVLARFDGTLLPYVSVAPLYGMRDVPVRDHKILLGLILGGKMRVMQVYGPLGGSGLGANENYHYRLTAAQVAGSGGAHETAQEHKMAAKKKHSDVEEFKEFLDKAVILVAGEGSQDIDPYAEEVHVAIVVNATGYGPHPGAIYVDQNRLHASPDTALETAYEILEEWEREHYPMSDEDEEHRTETFDGRTWTLPALAFTEAIYGTKAEQFIDVLEDEEDEDEDDEESDEDEEGDE